VHGQRLESVERKQDAHSEVLGQIMRFGEDSIKRFDKLEVTQTEHTKRFDQIDTRFDKMEATQAEILALLKHNRPDK
jgi:hypothetical protein